MTTIIRNIGRGPARTDGKRGLITTVALTLVLAASAGTAAASTPAPIPTPASVGGASSRPSPTECQAPEIDNSPAPQPAPSPQPGASPNPHPPKPGTPGNCTPHAPNSPAPQPLPEANPPGSGPSWWDIPGQIEQAIDTWIGNLAQAALTPILGLFTAALLTEPDVTDGRIAQLWQANAVLADSFYVLYVLFGGLLVLGYGMVQSRYTASQIVPRLIVGMLASNLSLPVIGLMLQFAAALAQALWDQPINPAGLGNELVSVIIAAIFLPDGLTQIVMAIFALVICVLAIAVLVSCVMRIAGLMILTALAPLMLTTHALPGIDSVARLWWRCTAALLAIQILQTLTFMLLIQVFCDPHGALVILPTRSGATDFLVGTALLLIMLKIPSWVMRAVLGHSPRTVVGSLLRTAAVAGIGCTIGTPGASSTRAITGRLVADRFRRHGRGHGGGPGGGGQAGKFGTAPYRPRGPRTPGGASAQRRHAQSAARTPRPGSSANSPKRQGAALPTLGGRGYGASRGSHPSGQMALWPTPRGHSVPQPWWGPSHPATTASSAPPAPQSGPGWEQSRLPMPFLPPEHAPGRMPKGRAVPLFTVPRDRRTPNLPPPAMGERPLARPPRPEQHRQLEIVSRRAVRALQPAPPKRAPRQNHSVLFIPPVFPEEGAQ